MLTSPLRIGADELHYYAQHKIRYLKNQWPFVRCVALVVLIRRSSNISLKGNCVSNFPRNKQLTSGLLMTASYNTGITTRLCFAIVSGYEISKAWLFECVWQVRSKRRLWIHMELVRILNSYRTPHSCYIIPNNLPQIFFPSGKELWLYMCENEPFESWCYPPFVIKINKKINNNTVCFSTRTQTMHWNDWKP